MTYTRAGESHGFGQAQGAPHACEDQPTLRRSVRGHYQLTADIPARLRLAEALDELCHAI